MSEDKEGFATCWSEARGDWYIVQRKWQGNVLSREILGERYPTEEDAEEARIALIEASL